MKVNFLKEFPEKINFELFVTTLFNDERPPRGLSGLLDWYSNGKLSNLMMKDMLTGDIGEHVYITGGSRLPLGRFVIFGMGASTNLSQKTYSDISSKIVESIIDMKFNSICCGLPGFHKLNFEFSRAIEIFLHEIERRKVGFRDMNILWVEDLVES
ncbi:MAG TPA: M17 family peptidase N-terminal domain-containing protein [bacterium]